MGESINNPDVGIHLLRHTLRSLCDENSLWIYAVFWRLLPRNHPPPTWNFQRGARNMPIREKRRNWMLAWEDGHCNFAPSTAERSPQGSSSSSAENSDIQYMNGLQPQLFYKMSHEIYTYGEGLVGKVAADGVHKYVHDSEQMNLSAWQTSGGELHPKTWGPQFQSGIKTIALIAVEEGVLQLGAVRQVPDDFSYVVQLQNKFSHLLNIPGFLLPRPPISSWCRIHSRFWFPFTTSINFFQNSGYEIKGLNDATLIDDKPQSSSCWLGTGSVMTPPTTTQDHILMNRDPMPLTIIPSMSSLDKLLCKLPSVVPGAAASSPQFRIESTSNWLSFSQNGSNVGNGEDDEE